MRGKQVPAHRTEIQFNQLMESELSTPHPLPATKSIFLQQHIHYSRVCTKCFNGFAIRATIIVHQQVLGIMFGCIYSCKPIKQRATKKEIWESVWKRVKKTGEGRLLWLKVFVIYTFFLEFSTFPLCMSNMVLYITHCTVAFTYQEFCSWIRINTSDGFFFFSLANIIHILSFCNPLLVQLTMKIHICLSDPRISQRVLLSLSRNVM